MKPVLETRSANIDYEASTLICEVCDEGFSFLVKGGNDVLHGLCVYQFREVIAGPEYAIAFKTFFDHHDMLSENFSKTYLIYSMPESVLIPFEMYNSQNNADILSTVHGDIGSDSIVLTDVLIDEKIYNTYRVPADILKEMMAAFPNAQSCHQYSVLLKNIMGQENKMSVIFYSQKIVLMAQQDGRLLLVNSFPYKSPEDVSYILLNSCRQLALTNVSIELSGLIDKDSALFKEIYKYFEKVTLSSLPGTVQVSAELETHPSHFFSHFFGVEKVCE
ncbi:MAG: DUF3822 family protein [Ginsengibacter sp.]